MMLRDQLQRFTTGDRAPESDTRTLSASRDGLPTTVGAFAPAIDVEEGEDAYTIHAELPGIDSDDLEVALERDLLTIRGERRFYDERDTDRFRRVERHFGRFHRTIRLPYGSETEGIEATYRDGVLVIHVPKQDSARRQRIAVRSAA